MVDSSTIIAIVVGIGMAVTGWVMKIIFGYIGTIKQSNTEDKQSLNAKIDSMKESLSAEVSEVKDDLTAEISEVKKDLKSDLDKHSSEVSGGLEQRRKADIDIYHNIDREVHVINESIERVRKTSESNYKELRNLIAGNTEKIAKLK